jgi:hypothetical protein
MKDRQMNLVNRVDNKPIVILEGNKKLIKEMSLHIDENSYMYYITFKNKYINYEFINSVTLLINSDEIDLNLKISLVNDKGECWSDQVHLHSYKPLLPIRDKSYLSFGYVYIPHYTNPENIIKIYKEELISK